MKTIAFAMAVALSAAVIASMPADAPAQPAGGLTNDALVATLTQMGYAPRPLSHGYLISVKRGSWTLYVDVVLSSDGSKLGLNANLGDVTVADVTAGQWMAILAKNEDIDPSSFYLQASNGRLMLHRVLDNRAVSAEYLRTQLDEFMDQIQSTESVWSPIAH